MFGIRDVHYAFYCVVLVGEITIRFLSNLAQKSIVAYPEFMQAIDYEFEINHQIPTRVRDKTLSLCLLLRSTS